MCCRDFRKMEPPSQGGSTKQSDIDDKAAEIKKMYIGNSAERQVNLKGSVEAKVLKGLQEVPIKKSVFAWRKVEKRERRGGKRRRVVAWRKGKALNGAWNLTRFVVLPFSFSLPFLSLSSSRKSTVFIDAEEEILALMSSDSFGRFKSSDLFKTCIETVNSPYTAILRKLYLL